MPHLVCGHGPGAAPCYGEPVASIAATERRGVQDDEDVGPARHKPVDGVVQRGVTVGPGLHPATVPVAAKAIAEKGVDGVGNVAVRVDSSDATLRRVGID